MTKPLSGVFSRTFREYLNRPLGKPLIKRVRYDRPVDELYALFRDRTDTALLNSSMATDAGRYSYIGLCPFAVITSKGNNILINDSPVKGDPFEQLNSIIGSLRVENTTSLPFVAGGIGYLSYDLKDLLEDLPSAAKDDLALPDMYFVFYQALLIHDRKDPDHIQISVLEGPSKEAPSARTLLEDIEKQLSSLREKDPADAHNGTVQELASNFTKQEYISAIEKTLEHIKAGNIYQLCLSQRFEAGTDIAPFELYKRLNKINPAPFSSFLNFRKARVISSSPELYLKVANGLVETRPMKGTRPRGCSPGSDDALRKELAESPKDAAELVMIVDLERNDLGRISEPGSVKVEEQRRIEAYPTVFQTIARITGRIGAGISLTDVIKATFPGGSITGCPKIRAMQIIEELEPTKRNVYCGAIGYISFHDTMELNIAIRTMIMKGGKVYFQAGGGIVSDSDPEAEYLETLDKAKAMMRALGA